MVAAGVAVFYADQFKAVLAADGVFLAVAGLHGGIAVVFQPVQLNGQHRQFLAALLLVDDKIKPPGVKQIPPGGIVGKHLGDRHFFVYHAPAAAQQGVVQRVVEVLQKGRFRSRAVRLDAQCPGVGGLFADLGLALRAGVLHEFVEVIVAVRPAVQAVQLRHAGQDDQLFPRAGNGHVDKLLIVFQPIIGALLGAVRQRQREDDYVLFIPLERVYRAAAGIGDAVGPQGVLDQRALPRKGRDDAYAFVRVLLQKAQDRRDLAGCGIAFRRSIVLYFNIDQRLLAFHAAGNVQAVVVIFAVVEVDDLLVAAVVIAQKHLVADGIAGQKALVDGVLDIIILVGHGVLAAQDFIVARVQHHHGAKLLRVAHQQQAAPAQHRHQRYRRAALAGFVHNDHVKQRFRLAQFVGRTARSRHQREDAQKVFQIILVGQVFIEILHQFLRIQRGFEDLPQRGVAFFADTAQIFGRGKVQIAVQLGVVAVQKCQRILGRNGAAFRQLLFHRVQLAQQLNLEVHLPAGFQQTFQRFFSFLQFQDILVPLQQLGQFPRADGALFFVAVQRFFKHLHLLAACPERAHRGNGLFDHGIAAQPDDGERDLLAFILEILQLFHHAVNGVVVVRRKQNCALVKKSCRQHV